MISSLKRITWVVLCRCTAELSLPCSQHHFVTLFSFLLLLPELPAGVKLPQAVSWHKNSCLSSWHSWSSDKGSLSSSLAGQGSDGSAHSLLLSLSSSTRANICPTTLRVGKKRKEKVQSVVNRCPQRKMLLLSILARLAERILNPAFVSLGDSYKDGSLTPSKSVAAFILNICIQMIMDSIKALQV